MADITGSVSRNPTRFTYYLRCTEQDVSGGTDNRSKVRVGIRIASSGSSRWASRELSATHTIVINGVSYTATSGSYVLQGGQDIEIASVVSDWIGHNSDGSKTISISASSPDLAQGGGYGPYSGSASGDMTLTTIPRHAYITSISLKSRTTNSLTFQFTADRSCSIYLKMTSPTTTNWLNNGNPFISNVTSGSFTVNYANRENSVRLSPNTAYTFSVLCRATVSGLDSASSASGTTYDIAKFSSVPNVNIGSSQTITWTNPSGAATSLVLYRTDGSTVINNFGTVTGTSKSYTANANTIYQLTPNSSTYKARYTITTTQNGQSYTNSADFNFVVADNASNRPIFSNFEYEDINTNVTTGTTRLTGDTTVLIKNYSIVKAIISTANKAQAQNYATMTDNGAMYKFIIGDQSPITASYSADNTVYLSSLLATNNVLSVSARDSRGLLTQVDKTLAIGTKFISYEDLKITSVTATRNLGGAGQQVTLAINGTFWNNSFGAVTNHIKSVIYEYKEASSSTWITGATSITVTESGSNFSFSGAVQGDLGATGFDISKSFNIRITVKDELSTKTNTITLGAGNPAIAISSDNKVAIGQKYDTSVGGALQVNGDIKGNNFSGNSTTATTSSYLKTPNTAGYQTNQYGNLQHQRNTSSDAWQFLNNAGTAKAEYVWETGVFKSNGLELNTKPVVLYNNTSGTTGTVTLSQTAANFTYLKIYAVNNDDASYAFPTTVVYSPNGKKCFANSVQSTTAANNYMYNSCKIYAISGTSITVTKSQRVITFTGNNSFTLTDYENWRVVRVEGYK